MFMGSNTIKTIISKLDDDINFINETVSTLTQDIKKFRELTEKQQLLHFLLKKFIIAELIRKQRVVLLFNGILES